MKNALRTVLAILLLSIACQQSNAACNWADVARYTYFWDTCTVAKKSLNAHVEFDNLGCYKFKWTVNGVHAGTGNTLNYPVTQNGTYRVCLAVIDSCNQCDTVICSTRVLNCPPPACNWATNIHPVFWDSCSTTGKSVNGYISSNSSCLKFQWKVNGINAGTGNTLHYPVQQNGTYNVCVAVIDSCNRCDTVICSTRVINCTSTPHCTFNYPYALYYETCTAGQRSLIGMLNFANGATPCFKFKWKVNGVVVGTGLTLNYPVQQNGSYNVCVSVIDTCHGCDTTLCSVRVVNCPQPGCTWTNNHPEIVSWDSCTSARRSLNAYVRFAPNTNTACFKYKWKINGAIVSTQPVLNYPVTQNGTYAICVSVVDTCINCDTSICITRVINCTSPPRCNWNNIYTTFWDTCTATNKSLNGYVSYSTTANCYKYKWRVNGVVVDEDRILNYPVTQNGTYNVCLIIIDTCNQCDTTICSVRVINCTSTPHCMFNYPYALYYETCTAGQRSLIGMLNFANGATPCFKYKWKVNGVVVGTGLTMNYPVQQNGSYNVCVSVIDTCHGCDTTLCSVRVVNCPPPGCTWINNHPEIVSWDSCTSARRSLNAYVRFAPNTNTACYKYKWKVNGAIVSTQPVLNYPIVPNGTSTYNICVTVTDTCNNCDTTFCSVRVINCPGTPCNWASRHPHATFGDTCTSAGKFLKGHISFGTISNPSCLKYQWRVNGNVVGTGPSLYYPVIQNGTYNVCVAVIDTCNRCDTVICSTRVINCTSPPRCNWSSVYTTFWDTCTAAKKSLNGYVSYSTTANCYKYKWRVNGVVVDEDRILNYPVTQNGTYNVCLTIIDTCNQCDTTICSIRVINCTSTPHCTFNYPYALYYETCTAGQRSLIGMLNFANGATPCFKYKWKVNGVVVGTGLTLNYPVQQNGTYNVCVSVIDTCHGCDTTLCSVRVVNCPPPGCTWTTSHPEIVSFDSCRSLNAYVRFAPNTNTACYKYKWKVNGAIVSTQPVLNYNVAQNGTYNVCVVVIDSCNNCDTSICITRSFNCESPGCNWSGRHPLFHVQDTCTGAGRSVSGYISFNNSNTSCYKYKWKVNGNIVGSGPVLNYPVTQNGTYNVCVTVTDSCNNCDTTFCSVQVVSCTTVPHCTWDNSRIYTYFWDSCTIGIRSLNAYINPNSTSSCLKYQWKVNGVNAGTGKILHYPVNQNGVYNVCVAVIDSCNRCDTVICSTRYIECGDSVIQRRIDPLQIFPNPARRMVNLAWLEDAPGTYILMSATGQVLQNGQLVRGLQTLDISRYPDGIYTIRVQTDYVRFSKKIVVQR